MILRDLYKKNQSVEQVHSDYICVDANLFQIFHTYFILVSFVLLRFTIPTKQKNITSFVTPCMQKTDVRRSLICQILLEAKVYDVKNFCVCCDRNSI